MAQQVSGKQHNAKDWKTSLRQRREEEEEWRQRENAAHKHQHQLCNALNDSAGVCDLWDVQTFFLCAIDSTT